MVDLVPLVEADDACGGKALTLGRLLRAGVRVPDGVVVLPPWMDNSRARLLDLVGDGPFAVRSSGRFEDRPSASFAGQLLTLLDVERYDLASAVQAVARSVQRHGVAAYASRRGLPLSGPCPVLVQQMVRPRAAGVLFSRDPTATGMPSVIECVHGSGRPVVDGTATPERWLIEDAARRVQRAAEHGDVLTTTDVRRVEAAAAAVVEVVGPQQDIEWALDGDEVTVLQSRPITAPVSHQDQAPGRSATEADRLIGLGASPGTANGPVRLIWSLDDLPRVTAGDVLVCRTTSPAWTAAMLRSAAVVTEVGGLLSHAAIVAREFRLPAVVGVANAMTELHDGVQVEVDGSSGAITSHDAGEATT